jgi:ribonuclease VapC
VIVDTSAIMAIVLDEPESDGFLRKIAMAPVRRISVGTWIELGVVVERRHPAKAYVVDKLLRSGSFLFEPVSIEQAEIARTAYRSFGQASGHPARLNFGDCFAYALARATGEPLLYKGSDFAQTDIAAA